MTPSLRVARYELSFPAPARDASGTRDCRSGLLLRVTSRSGAFGVGEAAPLPGRSRETLEACERALSALRRDALPSERELESTHWYEAIARASRLLPPELAAARHALESALLDLSGILRNLPAPALLAEHCGQTTPAETVPLAAMIDERDAELASRAAERALGRGAVALKLKVFGSETDEAIVARVQALRERFGASLGLRLDANQSLGVEQTKRLCARLAPFCIDYLEEPVQTELIAELEGLPLPLAADESLLERELEALAGSGVRVVVLKPMMLGLFAAISISEAARRLGLQVVLSHSLDGPAAMAVARALALAHGPTSLAHGLAAHVALDAWSGEHPPHVRSGTLSGWSAAGLGFAGGALL